MSFYSAAEEEFVDEIVLITDGEFRNRIGYCDGEGYEDGYLAICFGKPILTCYTDIPFKYVRKVSILDLLTRNNQITKKLILEKTMSKNQTIDLLHELLLVENTIESRHEKLIKPQKKDNLIFLSHAHSDTKFVTCIANDLTENGFNVWLDIFSIPLGSNIVSEINSGIENCKKMIVFLSKESIKSQWVEKEWTAKYMNEIQGNKVVIIPFIIDSLDINELPILLKAKKYLKLGQDYTFAIDQLIRNLR